MGGGRVSVPEMVIKNDILGTVILTDVAYSLGDKEEENRILARTYRK